MRLLIHRHAALVALDFISARQVRILPNPGMALRVQRDAALSASHAISVKHVPVISPRVIKHFYLLDVGSSCVLYHGMQQLEQ